MLRDNNSVFKTFFVAVCLCLVCSLVVASAAVGLRGMIRANKERYRMSNVLSVAGFDAQAIRSGGGVETVFKNTIDVLYVNLDTGEEASAELAELLGVPVEELGFRFDAVKIGKENKPGLATSFERSADNVAGLIGGRENFAAIYLKKNDAGEVDKYIFPIRGAGLWSTLLGFIALDSDLETVAGITFYEHGETPGLGGEVDNPQWKESWVGKRVYAASGGTATGVPEVQLRLVKGAADENDKYGIDGLAGATITANGVTHLIAFWMGDRGYGPFIVRERNRRGMQATSESGGR